MKTRIPLEIIESVFFGDTQIQKRPYSEEDTEGNLNNDYTVIHLGYPPKPEEPPIPKYPRFERTSIPNNAPSTFYEVKARPEEPEEHVPPPRPIPRKIDPSRLSKNQRELNGKSPFEQDLIIIKRKNKMLRKIRPNPDPNSLKFKENVEPPQLFERELCEIRENNQNRLNMELEKQKELEKKEQRLKLKFEKDRQRLKKKRIDHQAQLAREQEIMRQQRLQIEMEEREKARELWENFVPDKPTRASHLKVDTCRRMLEHRHVEERRQKLNSQIRKEKSKEQTKRLQATLLRLQPTIGAKKHADKARKDMRAHHRKWMRWLKLTEQANDMRLTMLERIYADHENITSPEKGDADSNE